MKNTHKLTPANREEIHRRLKAGEKQAALAAEFGVTRQAISLLKKRKTDRGKSERFGRYLTEAETIEFRSVLESTMPSEHGLTDDYDREAWAWTHGRAHALAEKLFGEKLRKYPLVKMLRTWYPDDTAQAVGPGPGIAPPNFPHSSGSAPETPTPFPPRHRRNRSIDPEFEAFLQSPVGKKIQAGAIGNAIGIFEKNIRAEHPDAVIEHVAPSTFPPRPTTRANVRTGKHKGGNTSPAKKHKTSKRK